MYLSGLFSYLYFVAYIEECILSHLILLVTMANYPDKNDILNRFGGVIKNSLQTTFGPLHDDDTVTAIPVYQKSEFLIPEDAEQYLKDNKNNFTVFSLNVDSMERKWDQFNLFIRNLASKNLSFCAITLQECRIQGKDECKRFELPNYNLIPQGSICSVKGGLISYIRSDLTAIERPNLYKKSKIYEALFLEISGPLVKDKKSPSAIYIDPPGGTAP